MSCHFLPAAAAAKTLQSCPTMWPQRRQPTRLPRPWDSSGKNTGVGCHFLLLDVIKKQKHHIANKGPHSQSHGFPVVMYICESWTIKKAEHRRADASNCGAGEDSWESLDSEEIKPVLKEINPEYSLEGLMLKLKLQYLATWCKEPTQEKTLIVGKTEGKRRGGSRGRDG